MTDKVNEMVYTRNELMSDADSAFGVRPEVMAGAMAFVGKKEMTKTEAEAAVKLFIERVV